jgi:aldehyde:ferredoxin oxidoreductase
MLASVGYGELAGALDAVGETIQRIRWKTRFATGFDPETVSIPRRFQEVVTWKGKIDGVYLEELKKEYGRAIRQVADSV